MQKRALVKDALWYKSNISIAVKNTSHKICKLKVAICMIKSHNIIPSQSGIYTILLQSLDRYLHSHFLVQHYIPLNALEKMRDCRDFV